MNKQRATEIVEQCEKWLIENRGWTRSLHGENVEWAEALVACIPALPQPIGDDEAGAIADSEYRKIVNSTGFVRPVTCAMLCQKFFKIGFMAGGEVATQRVQDYVDAGGMLNTADSDQ